MAIDLRAALTERLGRPVVQYIGGLRDAGRTWREIADEVTARTQIEVSHESLRKWDREHREERYRQGEKAATA